MAHKTGLGGGSVDRHLARSRERSSLHGVGFDALFDRLRELGAEPARSRSGIRCLTVCHNRPHQGDRNLWFGPTEAGSWTAVCHSHHCTYRTIVNKVNSLGPLKRVDGSIAPDSMIRESAGERMAKRPPLFDDDQLDEIHEERANLFAHSFAHPDEYGYDTLVDYISDDRCISPEMMERAWLGWRPYELRLTIPYIAPASLSLAEPWRRGRQVYGRDRWRPHVWRDYDSNGRLRYPKLLTEEGWARWLYYPPAVDEEAPIPEEGEAWLVEGAVDALAGASCGLPTIGAPASGRWWPAWSAELRHVGVYKLHIVPDNDAVGRRFARLVKRRLRNEAPDMEVHIKQLDVKEGGDLIDFLKQRR